MIARYMRWSTVVTSDRGADLKWLRGFLEPGFETSAGGTAAYPHSAGRFALREDRVAFEASKATALVSARQEAAFLQDSGLVRLPVGELPDGSVVAYERMFDVAYRIDPCGDVELLVTPGHRPGRHARGALMRAVRERAMDHVLRSGDTILHAAGVVCRGRAILFAGPKRAGKTSLLSALLGRCRELSFLANDRVVLVADEAGPRARALPSIVSIRPESLEFVPGLAERLSGVAEDYCGRPIDGSVRQGVPPLSPRQYVEALGSTAAGIAPLHGLVFPRIDSRVAGFTCREMSADEVIERHAESTFGHACLGHRTRLFAAPASGEFPAAGILAERTCSLVRRVRCHEVCLGRDAYAPSNARALGDVLIRLMES